MSQASNVGMTLDELRESIIAVVEYNWQDEARDYEDQEENGREAHIFNHLRRLDEFVSSEVPE